MTLKDERSVMRTAGFLRTGMSLLVAYEFVKPAGKALRLLRVYCLSDSALPRSYAAG